MAVGRGNKIGTMLDEVAEERRGWKGGRLEADPCRLVNRRNGPEKGKVFAKKRTEVVNVDDAWITMY